MARRFIVKSNDFTVLDNDKFVISGSEVKHIQVLRHNIGDEIIINKFVCEITKMTKDTIELKYIKDAEEKGVPSIYITLYIAMLKNDKMDYVVQKAVELGVKNIVPFFSSNVIVKLDDKAREKRKQKLQVIADEACKQCGRTDVVQIESFINFNELVSKVEKNDINIFAYEGCEDKNSLKETLKICCDNKYKNIGCIIGAEGGFTDKEASELTANSTIKTVSLGSRILRAETACVNILSIVSYELE